MTALQTTLADLSATLETALASVHAGPRTTDGLWMRYEDARMRGYGGTFEEWHSEALEAAEYHGEEMRSEYGSEALSDPNFDELRADEDERD